MPYKIFGCKVNKFYLNQWLNYYESQGINLDRILLIASCVVTDRAKHKWIKEIKDAIKKNYEIHLTGCGTLKQGKLIDEKEFYQLYPELSEFKEKIHLLPEAPQKESQISLSFEKNIYTKHFVVIQNGCDNYCSFCATVLKRGKHRSRDLQEIIDEIKQIESQDWKEIVLTGINLAAWGCENTRNPHESKFSFLLHEILQKTSIPRIRISSIGPEYLDEQFFELATDERILPHFHFSIQSFSDSVLQQMRRNYSAAHLAEILKKIRSLKRPHAELISLGADLITGFPGETEEDFEETLRGVENFEITKLHAFPFSAHRLWEKIPATYFENQISESLKKERNRILIEKGEEIRTKFIEKNRGVEHSVLLEEYENSCWKGRTENYIQIEIPCPKWDHQKGEIISYTF